MAGACLFSEVKSLFNALCVVSEVDLHFLPMCLCSVFACVYVCVISERSDTSVYFLPSQCCYGDSLQWYRLVLLQVNC